MNALSVKNSTVIWLTCLASFVLNWPFLLRGSLDDLLKTYDVSGIIKGYHSVSDFWLDSLKWWNGPWLYADLPRFRPLASYLYYFECWIGFHIGWEWAGLMNFALFTACCLIVAEITRRFTKSHGAALVAGVMAAGIHFVNSHDSGWLIWFPMADNLLCVTLTLAALLCFDRWYVDGCRPFLALSWAAFIAACLTKETAWIFPLMAGAIVAFRPTRSRRWMAIQPALMFVCILFFASYRATVVPESSTPSLHDFRFASLFVTTHPIFQIVQMGDYWLLFITALITVVTIYPRATRKIWRVKTLIIALLLVGVLFAFVPSSVEIAYRISFAPMLYARLISEIVAQIFCIFLTFRYGKAIGKNGIAALCLAVLAYIPTIPYIVVHWHYAIFPWFFMCVAYGVLSHMLILHAASLSVKVPCALKSNNKDAVPIYQSFEPREE